MLLSQVVTALAAQRVQVAFDEALEDGLPDSRRLVLLKLCDDVTFRRYTRCERPFIIACMWALFLDTAHTLGRAPRHAHRRRCLEDMKTYSGPAMRLLDILFGSTEPLSQGAASAPPLINSTLNAGQRETVAWALGQADVAVIHGPPGTGKTTTLVEVVAQLARQGRRVLACAPSNIAVDNMVERLTACGVDCVRVGHPARMLDTVIQVCAVVSVP